MAAYIREARFIEFSGEYHLPWENDSDRIRAEIEAFVTGTHGMLATNRFLTTVQFLDIVGSTERAAQLGDTAWLGLLKML